MKQEQKLKILEKSWKKFIAISSDGEFRFSRGLFREDGLDPSTHCYLAYSPSHRAVLFCFTRGLIASGAFKLNHQWPRGATLKAPAFFEHFQLNLKGLKGSYPVTKMTREGVDWHLIRFPSGPRPGSPRANIPR